MNLRGTYMKNTTLCYIEKDDAYLMLHRTKKENDENKDKWIGVGGKLEPGETPFDCARREILEETNLIPKSLEYRGIITFVSDEYGTEYMHLFKCTEYSGSIRNDCDEGELVWVRKYQICDLPIWEGDKIFLKLLDEEMPFFSLKLVYSGDKLISHHIEY
jgi:8-oxo-dGTP diphosphatase